MTMERHRGRTHSRLLFDRCRWRRHRRERSRASAANPAQSPAAPRNPKGHPPYALKFQVVTRHRSGASGLNVTEHVAVAAQEYDAVTGRIRFIPFQLVIRDFHFGSDGDVRPAARLVGPV